MGGGLINFPTRHIRWIKVEPINGSDDSSNNKSFLDYYFFDGSEEYYIEPDTYAIYTTVPIYVDGAFLYNGVDSIIKLIDKSEITPEYLENFANMVYEQYPNESVGMDILPLYKTKINDRNKYVFDGLSWYTIPQMEIQRARYEPFEINFEETTYYYYKFSEYNN